jgi:hypothetical protein
MLLDTKSLHDTPLTKVLHRVSGRRFFVPSQNILEPSSLMYTVVHILNVLLFRDELFKPGICCFVLGTILMQPIKFIMYFF